MSIAVCASCYVIDFEKKELLMVNNKKLGKWLQPGGHIEGEETPQETAIREVSEETGVDIKLIGNVLEGSVQPFSVKRHETRIGPMIDIKFVGIAKNKAIIDKEHNNASWIPLNTVMHSKNIEDEIKEKFLFALDNYKKYVPEKEVEEDFGR